MDITISTSPGGWPSYPYYKVVIVADRAEVAALPCDGAESENIVFHSDLLKMLHGKYPELEGHKFTAGWLGKSNAEALLYLPVVKPISQEEAERIGDAIGNWCETNGITKLTVLDTSPKKDAGPASPKDWENFEDWLAQG
jgi:hypothetical protein